MHNMLEPASYWGSMSLAGSKGACVGSAIGSFFPPAVLLGIVIGGVVGIAAYAIYCRYYNYELSFNPLNILGYKTKSGYEPLLTAATSWQFSQATPNAWNPVHAALKQFALPTNSPHYYKKKDKTQKKLVRKKENQPNSNQPKKDDNDNKKHPHGKYEEATYHHQNSRGGDGKSPTPIDGQEALDNSVPIKPGSSHRVGISKDQIVILRETIKGIYHGFVVTAKELISKSALQEAYRALIKSGFITASGKIIFGR